MRLYLFLLRTCSDDNERSNDRHGIHCDSVLPLKATLLTTMVMHIKQIKKVVKRLR